MVTFVSDNEVDEEELLEGDDDVEEKSESAESLRPLKSTKIPS